MAELQELTFGDADHLPGVDALDFSWRENALKGSRAVAAVSGYQEAVVRLQPLPLNIDYWAIAQKGIDHFRCMQDCGLQVPPQRFVVAPPPPDMRDQYLRLYTFTNRLVGRELTSELSDAAYAPMVLDGLAKYFHGPTTIQNSLKANSSGT